MWHFLKSFSTCGIFSWCGAEFVSIILVKVGLITKKTKSFCSQLACQAY